MPLCTRHSSGVGQSSSLGSPLPYLWNADNTSFAYFTGGLMSVGSDSDTVNNYTRECKPEEITKQQLKKLIEVCLRKWNYIIMKEPREQTHVLLKNTQFFQNIILPLTCLLRKWILDTQIVNLFFTSLFIPMDESELCLSCIYLCSPNVKPSPHLLLCLTGAPSPLKP